MTPSPTSQPPPLRVEGVTLAYGDYVVMRDITFTVNRSEIVVIMGGSGCGKSTLLKHLIGLRSPAAGTISYEGKDYFHIPDAERDKLLRRFGVLFQGGALFSSRTLSENVAMPMREHTDMSEQEIAETVSYKLALVGLRGFENYYPAEISGGMKKRAGLARALALDPDYLFFDEPSAGLDPVSSRRLDDLILHLRDSLKTSIIVVTHELSSIFAIADRAIYLDAVSRRMLADAPPAELLARPPDPCIREFLTRAGTERLHGANS